MFPATEYEFKWSNVSADLSPSQYATHGVLVNDSLVPEPDTSGTTQTLTIEVPEGLSTNSFFPAMRTRDDRGETGRTDRKGHNLSDKCNDSVLLVTVHRQLQLLFLPTLSS